MILWLPRWSIGKMVTVPPSLVLTAFGREVIRRELVLKIVMEIVYELSLVDRYLPSGWVSLCFYFPLVLFAVSILRRWIAIPLCLRMVKVGILINLLKYLQELCVIVVISLNESGAIDGPQIAGYCLGFAELALGMSFLYLIGLLVELIRFKGTGFIERPPENLDKE